MSARRRLRPAGRKRVTAVEFVTLGHGAQEAVTAREDAVESPEHYTWLGQALAALGLRDVVNVESWDVLDALFPDDPLLWNAGKYLTRRGRKGVVGMTALEAEVQDLRKARAYLDRRITTVERKIERGR